MYILEGMKANIEMDTEQCNPSTATSELLELVADTMMFELPLETKCSARNI